MYAVNHDGLLNNELLRPGVQKVEEMPSHSTSKESTAPASSIAIPLNTHQ